MDKERALEIKINRLLEMFSVVAVIGPRQCGKSTLVRHLRPDWKYYDLESPDDYQLISSDPVAFFAMNPDGIIIDEAQQYPELFKVLRGVIDGDRKRKGRFLVNTPAFAGRTTRHAVFRIRLSDVLHAKACAVRQPATVDTLYSP